MPRKYSTWAPSMAAVRASQSMAGASDMLYQRPLLQTRVICFLVRQVKAFMTGVYVDSAASLSASNRREHSP